MSIYLILVVLTLPGPNPPTQEMAREWVTASTDSVCQVRADKLATEQRQKHADILQRLQAKVVGVCVRQGATP